MSKSGAAHFSSERQPSAESKRKGFAVRRLFTKLLNLKLQGDQKKELLVRARQAGLIDVDPTPEVMIFIAQLERAYRGDTKAAEFIFDRCYGKPVQAVISQGENLIQVLKVQSIPFDEGDDSTEETDGAMGDG